MPYSIFRDGFADGVVIRGIPILQAQPGEVFYVGNGPVLRPNAVGGANGNRGTFLDPFATLTYAVNTACGPGRGDIVFIMPNHKETLSNATTALLQCSGVAVVGLGAGESRPTFTYDTADTANIPVWGANISIQNCIFVANYADVASLFTAKAGSVTASILGNVMTVTASGSGVLARGLTLSSAIVTAGTVITEQLTGTTGAVGTYRVTPSQTAVSGTITTKARDFAIDHCEFRDVSSSLNALSIMTLTSVANAEDGFQFTNNRVDSKSTTAATYAIVQAADIDRMIIAGNFGVHAILNDKPAIIECASNEMTNVEIAYNNWFRANTSSTNGSFVGSPGTSCTGLAHHNFFSQRHTSAAIWIKTGHGLGMAENFSEIAYAADKNAAANPIRV